MHRVIRGGDLESTQKIFQKNGGGSTLFAIGKNTLGRCSLHIAVLGEHVDIVRYIAENYPETLRIGDNVIVHLKNFKYFFFYKFEKKIEKVINLENY